ncbi:MAG: isoleucine--tRNA ligase [Candidatus Micrarchaeota archaeon]
MYDHKKIETEMTEFLEKNEIYDKAKKKNANGECYYFCDGPPYTTGYIHPGTAWGKNIKDSVCRYWRMRNYNVLAKPGFDTHGLPIEVKVEQELKIKKKKEIEEKGIEQFVVTCKSFVNKYIEIMTNQFKSMGVWMDWNSPYITYYDNYIESSWKTLKLAYDKGLMHQGIYVLPYCYRCETTMANYELEYDEETNPSLYVKFKIKENEYLVIWTTTPWTLVANMAIMVNPKFTYVKAKIDNEIWVIAKEKLDDILNFINQSATILEECSGKKLEGMEYQHPFQNLIKKEVQRKIVLSDEYVSLENGTGLVHCAPGHGQEDFIIGKRCGLEIFSPVDSAGIYTDEAGTFAGKNVRNANLDIINILKENKMLIHEERIKHRYPHCWRCKTPLIFRATDQWFITISKLKDKMLSEIETTEWHPEFAKERFREFVAQAPDWCISRQRYWGIPLPIWKCTKCDNLIIIGTKSELQKIQKIQRTQKNKIEDLKELHRPYVDKIILRCKCKGEMHRIRDVLDVWFDSGNAVWAGISEAEAKKFGTRAELILEGQDQIRGWFYSLLGSGLLHYDKIPYKRVMMHGFFVDEKGEKMSKSIGNFISLEEILDKYGADSFRLWGISNAIWGELNFNWNELKEAHGDLDILFNICVFLERFYPKTKIMKTDLCIEDRWLFSRLHSTLKEFHKSFEAYEPHGGVKRLRKFLVEDLSRFYMKIAKDRISKDENAQGALFTIYSAIFASIKMFAIISPFISEYIYQKFFRKYENIESITLFELEVFMESEINTAFEKRMEIGSSIISCALDARQRTGIKLRWPIRDVYVKISSDEIKRIVVELSIVLKRFLNAKEIIVTERDMDGTYEAEEFEGGKVFINKKLDEELYEEGVYNEVKRRVQQMRKELALVEKDRILIQLDMEKEIESIIKKYEEALLKETNAISVSYPKLADDSKIFSVDGRVVRLKLNLPTLA